MVRGHRVSISLLVLLLAIAVGAGAFGPSSAVAAPAAPNWLPGQPMLAGNQVIAMWLPVIGAVKYVIYLNGDKLMESPANQYIGLAPDKPGEWQYQVTAVDAAGAEGPKSGVGMIRIVKLEPPAAPIIRTDPDSKSFLVGWNKPAGAAIFNLYRASAPEGPWNLIVSTQEQNHRDADVEFETKYFYTVSIKDVTGKESEKSPAADALLAKPKVQKAAKSFPLKVVTTQPAMDLDYVGPIPVNEISKWVRSPKGRLFGLVSDMLLEVDENLSPVYAYLLRPDRADQLGELRKGVAKVLDPYKGLEIGSLYFADEETAVFVSAGRIFKWDLGRNEVFWASKPFRIPTQQEDPATVAEILPQTMGLEVALSVVVPLADGGFWVADRNHQIWGVYDEAGELVSWFKDYFEEKSEGEFSTVRMVAGTEMYPLEGSEVLLNLPLNRVAVAIDTTNRRARYVIGQSATMVGNFIGWGGSVVFGGGKKLLVTDPTMHTMQVFDLETGDYVYNIGGEEAKADPKQTTRALITFNAPKYPVVLKNDTEFGFFVAFQKYLQVFKVKNPEPVTVQ